MFSFQDALWGGVENGTAFLEAPIPAAFRGAGSTPYEDWRWFFDQVLLPESRYSSERWLYWGSPIDPQYLDASVLEEASTLTPGTTLPVRTPQESGVVVVNSYAVHCDDAAGRCILLIEATPVTPLNDTRFLIAGPNLPPCDGPCVSHNAQIEPDLRKRIRDLVVREVGLRHPSDSAPQYARENVEIVAGHFSTLDEEQYAAYVNLYDEGESGLGNWALVLVGADLSILSVLDQGHYLHAIPMYVSDVNQDGLHEIWVNLSGYEGGATGMLFLEQLDPLRFGEIGGIYSGL